MKNKAFIATLLLAAGGIVAPANATLLVNGNFDNGLADWTIGSIVNGSGFVATNFQLFGLTPPSAQFRSGASNFRTLSQSIATTAGARYKIDFSVLAQQSAFDSIVDVTTGDTVTRIDQSAPFAWTPFSYTFSATGDTSLIQFAVQHGGVGQNFLFIDDVTVTNFIPEPASWTLLILGFGLVGVSARRRREGNVRVA